MAALFAGVFGAQPTQRVVGARVMLRPPRLTDWQDWARLRSDSHDFLKPWEPSWGPDGLTRSAFRRRLARYQLDWRHDEAYSFFIFRNTDETLLGGIALSQVRRGVAESASLGYWVGEIHARQGIMTEALRLAIAFAFNQLNLRRLEAACLPSNAPSRHLLAKAGFRQEGQARDYLCIDGVWQDHVLYALLRRDWEAAGGAAAG